MWGQEQNASYQKMENKIETLYLLMEQKKNLILDRRSHSLSKVAILLNRLEPKIF